MYDDVTYDDDVTYVYDDVTSSGSTRNVRGEMWTRHMCMMM